MSHGDVLLTLARWLNAAVKAPVARWDSVQPQAALISAKLATIVDHLADPTLVKRLLSPNTSILRMGLKDLKAALNGADYALALRLAPVLTENEVQQLAQATQRPREVIHHVPRTPSRKTQDIADVASVLQKGPIPREVVFEVLTYKKHLLDEEACRMIAGAPGNKISNVLVADPWLLFAGVAESLEIPDQYTSPGTPSITALGALTHSFAQVMSMAALMTVSQIRESTARSTHVKIDVLRKNASFMRFLESHPLIQLIFYTYYGHDKFLANFDSDAFNDGYSFAGHRQSWEWVFRAPLLVFAREDEGDPSIIAA